MNFIPKLLICPVYARDAFRAFADISRCTPRCLRLIAAYLRPSLPVLVEANCHQQAAIEETKAVFPSLRKRIADALERLEEQLEVAEEKGATEQEIAKAQEIFTEAKATAS